MIRFVEDVLKTKRALIEKLEGLLSEPELRVARLDHHSKRPPRPCGITIHPGSGCNYECRYCYIYDMGFGNTIVQYHLSGLQLAYSLLTNRYFVPGPRGTYLAIGSITEPLHPVVRERTIEYIETIYQYLENPTQFSSKQYIDTQLASKLSRISKGRLSPLVTVVTYRHHDKIEPKAPRPDTRLESIRNLREAGLKPFLFIRPIIPGVTEHEYRELLELAKESGAVGVVAGSLRMTRSTLEKLREAGIDTGEILRRARMSIDKMKPGIQYDVYTSDIKQLIAKYASKIGLIYYPSACMANLFTHGLRCWRTCIHDREHELCKTLEEPTREELKNIVSELGGRLEDFAFNNGSIYISVKCRACDLDQIKELIRSRYMACVKIKRSR